MNVFLGSRALIYAHLRAFLGSIESNRAPGDDAIATPTIRRILPSDLADT